MTNKYAVIRGVEALVVTLNLVNCDALESCTTGECTGTDKLDSIGNLNVNKSGAISKSVLENGSNLCAVVVLGNGYVLNLVDKLACSYGIGAVLLKAVLKYAGIVEGISNGVSCKGITLNAVTVFVGKLSTFTCGLGEPTKEGRVVRLAGYRYGKYEVGGEGSVCLSLVGNVGDIVAAGLKLNLIGLGSPVSVKNYVAGVVEVCNVDLLTVAVCGTGSVVPTVEVIAAVFEGGGKSHDVADSNVLGVVTGERTAYVSNRISVNLKGYPLGAAKVGVLNLDGVDAALGELNLGRGTVYGDSLAAVNSYEIVGSADNGSPGNSVSGVVKHAVHYKVTHVNSGAERRSSVSSYSLNRNAVVIAGNENNVAACDIVGVGVSGDSGVTNLNGVRGSAFNSVPGNSVSAYSKTGRSCGDNLSEGSSRSIGRVVTIGNGSNLDGKLAGVVSKAEAGLVTNVNLVGVGAVGKLYVVGSSVLNGEPYECIVCSIVGNACNRTKISFVNEGLGYGISIALCGCGNGDLNTTLLHRAVSDGEYGRGTVIKSSVLMSGVAAINGYIVLLSSCNRVINKDTVDNGKLVNHVKSLVCEGSYSSFGILRGVCSNSGNRYGVLTCGIVVEVEGVSSSTNVLVSNLSAVSVGDNNVVGYCAAYRFPLNGILSYACLRSDELGRSIVIPNSIESCILVEYKIFGVSIRKLCSILIHTDPPTAEGVTLSLGSCNTVSLLADGRQGLKSGSVGVSEIKGDIIFGRTDSALLRPFCVYRGVRFYGNGIECEGNGACLVCVPSEEDVAFFGRISGLAGCFAVNNSRCIYSASAIHIIADSVIDLLEEVHRRAVCKGNSDILTVNYRSSLAVLISDIVKNQSAFVCNVSTGLVHTGACNSEFIAAAQSEQDFAAGHIVVVNSYFSAFGVFRSFVAVSKGYSKNHCCYDKEHSYDCKGNKPYVFQQIRKHKRPPAFILFFKINSTVMRMNAK